MTGNGTTAMFLFFKTLKKKTEIIYPSITCVQAVNAAIFAGHKVIFSDVSSQNYTMSINNLKKVFTKKTMVAVPTHTFGNICEIEKIVAFCKKKKILVLEDATQSFGAKTNGKIIGSFGDASVLSFGYSKILDCGSGGCILTDNEKLYLKMLDFNRILNPKPNDYLKRINNYKKSYYDLKEEFFKNDKKFTEEIFNIQAKYKKIFIFKSNNSIERKIKNKLTHVKKIINNRKKKYNIYKKDIKFISKPLNIGEIVPWRFVGLINKKRDFLVNSLRKINIDVSTWYQPLHYISPSKKTNYKNSVKIGEKIINFWLDEKISIKKIKKDIKIINNI